MANINIIFVSNNYDTDKGTIKLTEKTFAYPTNVTINCPALQTALQNVISEHRSYLYTCTRSIEAGKKEPNTTTIERFDDAIALCEHNTPAYEAANDDEYRGMQLLAYAVDNSMHRSYLNGKPVMNMPHGGADLLTAFRDYKDGRCKFGDLKKECISFVEQVNGIPFLKNRTIKLNDDDVTELYNMYIGIGQVQRWNKKGINGRCVTKTALLQQVILKALKKSFKFEAVETVKRTKVTEF